MNNEGPDQFDLGLPCLSTYTTVSTDSGRENKGFDMRRLIWACIVRKLHKGLFHALRII